MSTRLTAVKSGATNRRVLLAGLAMTALAAAFSCNGHQSRERRVELVETGAPALHAVHSDDLREAMRSLQQTSITALRADVYTGGSTAQELDEVASAAAAIAETAEAIPGAAQATDISPQDRVVFERLAGKLKSDANALWMAASSGDSRRTQVLADRMTTTCNACHSAFRLNRVAGID